jgi:hypothetical protein
MADITNFDDLTDAQKNLILAQNDLLQARDTSNTIDELKNAKPLLEHIDSKENDAIHEDSKHISVDGHTGTWYIIGKEQINNKVYFLLESEQYGDEAASVIVDDKGVLIVDDVNNSFDDLIDHLSDTLTAKEQDSFIVNSIGIDLSDYNMRLYSKLINLQAERNINEHEAEYGADGRRAFPHLNDDIIEQDKDNLSEMIEVSYNILQLRGDPVAREYRMESLEALEHYGLKVDKKLYDVIYSGTIHSYGTYEATCACLFSDFNENSPRPDGYKGNSLSVSDIVQFIDNSQPEPMLLDFYVDRSDFKLLNADNSIQISYDEEMELRKVNEHFYGKIDFLVGSGIVGETIYYTDMKEYDAERTESFDCGRPISAQKMSKEEFIKECPPYMRGDVKFYDIKDCIAPRDGQDLKGKTVIIPPNVMQAQYQRPEYQLYYVIGKPGCKPDHNHEDINCIGLYDGEAVDWRRRQVLGVANQESLPDWAKDNLDKVMSNQTNKGIER